MQEKIQSVSGQSWPAMVNAGVVVGRSESVGASEMVCVVGDVVVGSVVTVGAGSVDGSDGNLLRDLWRFEGTIHWLTTRNALTDAFQSMLVGSLDEALRRAAEFAQGGFDIYLSPAEFASGVQTRKAQDVACVRGFWLDIDVGAVKAEHGQGYATLDEAKAAVKAFRIAAGLPRPTHVVCSGSGLHVYWVVDAPIEPVQWLVYAKMFKALTKSLGLLADPTRTADIASLMRVPGTFNFKDQAKPRAVTLIYASDKLSDKAVMLNAIDVAHVAHCGAVKPQTPALLKLQASHGPEASVLPKQWVMVPAQLQKLASALCALSPDVEEHVWSLHRIAPIARAARENPDLAVDLYLLARRWSSGELRGLASKAWTTSGGKGVTGEQYFDALWTRFLNDGYVGGRTLGSIYFEARAAGWQE